MERESQTGAGRTGYQLQFAEDPRCTPPEKQTAFHLEGDSSHFEVTSFRKVVFAKLLQRPAFEVEWLNVLDDDRREHTVESLDEVGRSETVIGVTGRLPVGAMNIGTPRNDNSHADIVKQARPCTRD